MCPPGLAMASVAEHLWEGLPPGRSFYFDWRRNRKAQQAFDAAFTPAVSLIRGLDVALGMLLDDGLEAAFDRHVRLGRATRAGLKAMGSSCSRPTTTRPRSSPPRAPPTASTPPSSSGTSATATASRSRRGRATSRGRSSASATSAGSTSSTSPPRSPRSSSRSRSSAPRSSAASPCARVRRLPEPAASGECRDPLWPEPVQRVSARPARRGRRRDRAGVPGGDADRDAAAAAVGADPDRIVKSLVFVCDGAYVLALVPGDRRGDEAGSRPRRARPRPGSRARPRSSRRPGSSPARRSVPAPGASRGRSSSGFSSSTRPSGSAPARARTWPRSRPWTCSASRAA